jgi:two-component system cell cycle sensor histidine kinase/response regulator CckA
VTRPHKILVVDDDAIVRRVVAMTLGRHCFQVHQADSGEDGLKSFFEHREDLSMVLTDIVMPGMSGPQMVERILATDPAICVMFMTGTATDNRLSPESARAHKLIHKPFTPASLLENVHAVLEACK